MWAHCINKIWYSTINSRSAMAISSTSSLSRILESVVTNLSDYFPQYALENKSWYSWLLPSRFNTFQIAVNNRFFSYKFSMRYTTFSNTGYSGWHFGKFNPACVVFRLFSLLQHKLPHWNVLGQAFCANFGKYK